MNIKKKKKNIYNNHNNKAFLHETFSRGLIAFKYAIFFLFNVTSLIIFKDIKMSLKFVVNCYRQDLG